MIDREKVISGLQRCRLVNKLNCDKCPYDYNGRGNGKSECTAELADDALALLKEQEHKDKMFHALEEDWKRLKAMLKEQEAENGEWITIWREDDPDTSSHGRCSVCNRVSERPLGVYCKWCGAKMNQE